jgi:hypothetical protein
MTVDGVGELVAPARRGSRDERREGAVRALAAGLEARCAFCGEVLPPIPAKGGRPSPYCPADPERYGVWGAKVISCAMLDEQREIWVRVYGADQPMTPVDLRGLSAAADSLTGVLATALAPVRQELDALRDRLAVETADAINARDDALRDRDTERAAAREARTDRDTAVQRAERAEQQAATDRAARATAAEAATTAERDRAAADTARQAAEADRDTAVADRQRALTQAATAQDRITELQATLARDRAVALADLDHLRRDAEAHLRESLAAQAAAHETALAEHTDQHRAALAAQARDHQQDLTGLTGQLQSARADADRRADHLTAQLTAATTSYAESLAPLHAELAAARTATATWQHHYAALHHTLSTAAATHPDLTTALQAAPPPGPQD